MTRKNALCLIFPVLVFIAIVVQSNCFAADSITWSPADAGLRLGLSSNQSSKNGSLRLVLSNVGTSDLGVFVGINSDDAFFFRFTAAGPRGMPCRIWDSRPEALRPIAGLIVPVVISLAPGRTREFVFPLKDLVYLDTGRNITLDSLLHQGYTLNASLEVQQNDLDKASMGGVPSPAACLLWTGHLICSLHIPMARN